MDGEDKSNFFGMSDEDFLKLDLSTSGSNEEASASSTTGEDDPDAQNQGDQDAGNTGGDDPALVGGASGDDTLEGNTDPDDDPEGEQTGKKDDPNDPDQDADAKAKTLDGAKPDADNPAKVKAPEGDDPAENDKAGKIKEVATLSTTAKASKDMKPEELASFYDQVMKPFKANGREINLRNPDEAIRLMQMGAGYGRKLQDMQPHLKTMRMLEKNGLIDEAKLSYLIELDKKNPEAIKKLIKDSGMDPLDLDMEDNAKYQPKDHSVTDGEVAFSEALKDVSSQPGGRETIQHINSVWDKQSKEFLWGNPEVLSAIQEQRSSGVYAQITAELDRKKMLGEIPPNVPFLEAYKIAGDALVAAKNLTLPGSQQASNPAQLAPALKADQQVGRVLGTRNAAPKSAALNSDKAKAASSTPSSFRKAGVKVNPLDMADDEFLKQFENRL